MLAFFQPKADLPPGFVLPSAALSPPRVAWEARAAANDWGNYLTVTMTPVPLERYGTVPDSRPHISLTPRGCHSGLAGRVIVSRWEVFTWALAGEEAMDRLYEAEPLIRDRMTEFQADPRAATRARWFRLDGGQLLDPCTHSGVVPVDLIVTGETVAWLCPDCDAQFPADWR